MTTDDAPADATADDETCEDRPKSYAAILDHEIAQGMDELQRPTFGLALSGLSAGLDVGFSLFFMAVVLTLMGGDLADPGTHAVVANMYPIGFIFVIIGRSELFTEHTTLAVFPVLSGRAGVGSLARLWGVVYSTNLLGAAIFAAIATWIGPRLGIIDPAAFGAIAHEVTEPVWSVTLVSGILAGWLMGLLSWTLSAARETVSRILLVWLVTAGIGLAGLHHSIVGTAEVLAGLFTHAVEAGDFVAFLAPATLGNALGGVIFVSLIKYSHATRDRPATRRLRR